jgi:hypothetical protein
MLNFEVPIIESPSCIENGTLSIVDREFLKQGGVHPNTPLYSLLLSLADLERPGDIEAKLNISVRPIIGSFG